MQTASTYTPKHLGHDISNFQPVWWYFFWDRCLKYRPLRQQLLSD